MKAMLLVSLFLAIAVAYEPYCYRPADFTNPRSVPLRCPAEGWFNYYDCCDENSRCCNYIKWPILLLFVLSLLGLLSGLSALFYYFAQKNRELKGRNRNRAPYTHTEQVPVVTTQST